MSIKRRMPEVHIRSNTYYTAELYEGILYKDLPDSTLESQISDRIQPYRTLTHIPLIECNYNIMTDDVYSFPKVLIHFFV